MSDLKILICDDDPDLLGLLVRRLDKMGVKPDLAENGRKALSLVEEHNYDVIVTDIYMPEATGLEVLQYAKQLDQDTQVVIITSSATLDNAIDALNHGAFGYLTKPFDHLIVFDNMVSRAIEYRHLLVADKHKAEAQKRRGDMLEEEVAERVQQLQKKQKGLLDLLGSLPDGVLVVEEGGKVVLSSPVGERWLARDEQSEQRPIHAFVAQVHAEMAEPSARVELDGHDLQLMSADFPSDGEAKRKAVIIREAEDSEVGAGSLVTDTVMGIKKGLATLYEQGLGTEIVLDLASQFAVLEQLSGWTGGTAELKAGGPAPAAAPPAGSPQAPSPTAEASASPSEPVPQAAEAVPADAPAPAPQAAAEGPPAEAPAQAPETAPESQAPIAEDPQPTTVSTTPPFLQPRERVNTAELDGPRMNTAQLEEALRSAGVPQAAEAPPPALQGEPAASVPAAEAPEPPAAEAPAPSSIAEDTQPTAKPQAEQPAAEPGVIAPEQASGETPPPAAAPAEPPAAPAADPEPQAALPQAEAPPAQQSPSEPVEARLPEPAEAPPAELSQPAEPLPATNGTGELEAAPAELEPEFPTGQPTGELDSSIFRPRMIPEEMDAKLETPTELPNTNGKRGLLARAKGPLKIQTTQADTQMFRKVLAGLSGSEVEGLSGEKEGPPKVKPQSKAKPEATQAAPAEPASAPVDQIEQQPKPVAEPKPDPQPQPTKASWPPTKPTEDPEWDDSLDVSG